MRVAKNGCSSCQQHLQLSHAEDLHSSVKGGYFERKREWEGGRQKKERESKIVTERMRK